MYWVVFQTLDVETDADALHFLLKSTKLLCLHAECLTPSDPKHEAYCKHVLRNLLIPK